MRHLRLAALLLVVGCGKPADTPPTPAAEAPAGRVGSPAPPLDASQWLQGDPVFGFEPGRVYALDFWASWCGPCLDAMPHVQQVADEFAGRATVVGVTAVDDRNPLPAVLQALGATKAGRSRVRHVVVPRATVAAYGISGYPTAVVVGVDGRVAFVGSPLLLDEVLDRVLAGTWQGRVSAGAVDALADELDGIYTRAARDPAAGLADLDRFAAGNPGTAGRVPFRVSKVVLLLMAGRFDQAKALTEELLPLLAARKDVRHLGQLRAAWADPKRNPGRQHAGLAVRAAEAVLAVEGEADPAALMGLADAHHFAGDGAKARELADRAVAAAPADSPLGKRLAERRKRYE